MTELRKMARDSGFNTEFDDYVIDHWQRFEKFARLINAAALAQPEPCADESDCDYMPWCRIRKACQKQARAAPLYTTPPQRKPLTDAEVDTLSRTMVKGDKSVNWLCRAVERAHGIE